MPKGALLHAHTDATVNVRVLLDLALKYPAFHVRTEELLTASNLHATLPKFRALPHAEWTEHAGLTEQSYAPGAWVPLHKARNSFGFGGSEGFDRWILGSLTISPAEAYRTHNTTTKASATAPPRAFSYSCNDGQIWDKFTSTFLVSKVGNWYL